MMPDDLDRRFHAAAALAREAGQLALRLAADRAGLAISMKGPQDWLTAADGAVERLIVDGLGRAFPADTILGEEGGGQFGASCWVIDPIDGTANYARGIAQFAVSIAYCRDDRVELGAIYDPSLDQLFTARRGAGAHCNSRLMRVSANDRPDRSVIHADYSHRHEFSQYLAMVGRLVDAGYAFRQCGSAALALAHTADGRLDGCCEYHLFPWDVLAGLLMVREAGGWTNDFLAGEGRGHGNAMLACTPALAGSLRALTGIA